MGSEVDALVLAVLSTSPMSNVSPAKTMRRLAELNPSKRPRLEKLNLASCSEIGNSIRDSSQSPYRARVPHP